MTKPVNNGDLPDTEAMEAVVVGEGAPEITGSHEDLGRSIQDAMDAARAAGIGVEEKPGESSVWFSADIEDRPHVSYSFVLENLPPAPDIDMVEEAVESLDGVECRVAVSYTHL